MYYNPDDDNNDDDIDDDTLPLGIITKGALIIAVSILLGYFIIRLFVI